MAAFGDLRNGESLHTGVTFGADRGIRIGWQELSGRYTEDRDCLASFLALELAEVLQGAKPANLVCLTNKRRSCGRNLYLLWKEHGSALLEESGLKVRALADRGSSLLLLLYSDDALKTLLAQKRPRNSRQGGIPGARGFRRGAFRAGEKGGGGGVSPRNRRVPRLPAEGRRRLHGVGPALVHLPGTLEDLRKPGPEPAACRTPPHLPLQHVDATCFRLQPA